MSGTPAGTGTTRTRGCSNIMSSPWVCSKFLRAQWNIKKHSFDLFIQKDEQSFDNLMTLKGKEKNKFIVSRTNDCMEISRSFVSEEQGHGHLD